MSNIFNEEDYLKILRNRFETKDIEFLKAEREPFSDDVEGFMCEHFILNITYKLNNATGKESFFIKTLPKTSEYQAKINEQLKTFLKETFAYKTFEEFKKYGYDISFAPRCYHHDDETIVFENMGVKHFRLHKPGNFLDIEHIKESLRALALFHANSIALEEAKSMELERTFRLDKGDPEGFQEVFFIPGDLHGVAAKFIQQTKVCFKTLCRFIPESEEWKRNFFDKLDRFDPSTVFHQNHRSRKTCGHGDLWSNNMLFRYKNGVPVKCSLVDYQLVRYHYPVYDVMLTIYSTSVGDFRKKHFKTLMKFYYQSFCEVLSGYGFDGRGIIPEDDFFEVGKALEPVALFQANCDRAFVCLPKNITNNLNDQESDVSLKDLLENDRSNIVVKCCEDDENLKKMFIDEIYDLNDHL